jgi:hypothetical protein
MSTEPRTAEQCERAEMFADIAGQHQWIAGLAPGWSVCSACERIRHCPECVVRVVQSVRIRRCIRHIGLCVSRGRPHDWPELLEEAPKER